MNSSHLKSGGSKKYDLNRLKNVKPPQKDAVANSKTLLIIAGSVGGAGVLLVLALVLVFVLLPLASSQSQTRQAKEIQFEIIRYIGFATEELRKEKIDQDKLGRYVDRMWDCQVKAEKIMSNWSEAQLDSFRQWQYSKEVQKYADSRGAGIKTWVDRRALESHLGGALQQRNRF